MRKQLKGKYTEEEKEGGRNKCRVDFFENMRSSLNFGSGSRGEIKNNKISK